MLPTELCYACNAALPRGASVCTGCGQSQDAEARAQYAATATERATRDRARQRLIGVGVACFVLGAGLGGWASSGSTATAPVVAVGRSGPMPREDVTDRFLRAIDRQFAKSNAPLHLTTWVPAAAGHPENGVILEMEPPEHGVSVWQSLNETDRQALMGFIGVAYTRALLTAGVDIDFPRSHPIIGLRYRGTNAILAARLADGSIKVYPSPYDAETSAVLKAGAAAAAVAPPVAP